MSCMSSVCLRCFAYLVYEFRFFVGKVCLVCLVYVLCMSCVCLVCLVYVFCMFSVSW